MNMDYTMDLKCGIGLKTYRLQTDGGWRRIPSFFERKLNGPIPIKEGDLVFDERQAVEQKKNLTNTEIELEGERYLLNPENGILNIHFSIASAYADFVPHKKEKPHIFTRDELKEVIASGNDEYNNVLLLDIDGRFGLRQLSRRSIRELDNDPSTAVYYPIFCAEHQEVGIEAAKEEDHINRIYAKMLDYWYAHLLDGQIHICARRSPKEPIPVLEQKVTELCQSI